MRTNAIHRSLYKPILFVGCERLPFIIITTICGVLIMAYQTLLICGISLLIYFIIVSLIRRVNKVDPQYFKCLWRYIRFFNDYYPANEFYPGKMDKPGNYLR